MEIILLCLIFGIFSVIIMYIALYHRFGGKVNCKCNVDMFGKTVLITGGSSGIGLETAVSIARMGARVIIASSNPYNGLAAVREIKDRSNNTNIVFYELNLEDFTSIRSTAENIINNESSLHVLINNAGISYHAKARTKTGCEKIFATNYLGHFLLTYLLVDLLRRSAPSRIVNVTSVGHKFVPNGLDFKLQDDNFGSDMFPHLRGYDSSKVAMVLFTKELARRISGVGITTNAVHPGIAIETKIWTNMTLWWPRFIAVPLKYLAWPFTQGVVAASQTVIHAAVSPDMEGLSGKYLEKCQLVKSSVYTDNALAGARLWSASMLLTGCTRNGQVIEELRVVNEYENKFDEISAYDWLIGTRKPYKEPDFEHIQRG